MVRSGMKPIPLVALCVLVVCSCVVVWQMNTDESDPLDYASFKALVNETATIRSTRRVSVEQFRKMADEPNTVILDTRSKRDYEDRHIKGALHLSYSDLNEKSLRELIPDPDTRVLIYCVNNFVPYQEERAITKVEGPENQTVTQQRMVAPARIKHIEVPKEYKTESKRVMVRPLPPNAVTRIVPQPDGTKVRVIRVKEDTVRVRKMVEPPKENVATSRYQDTEGKVLVADEGEELFITPAKYESRESRVMVSPPSKPAETKPARYETTPGKVMVKEAFSEIKVRPGEYEWVEEKVLVADEGEELVVTPGKYEMRESRVMVSPPSKRVERIPTPVGQKSRVMVSPPSQIVETIPARYEMYFPKKPQAKKTYDTSVALNVPTFLALENYGYKDVYELGPALSWHTPRLQFGGTSTGRSPTISAAQDKAIEVAGAKQEHVDFDAFVGHTEKNEALWSERLVSLEQFITMAAAPDTMILDVRSKAAFDRQQIRDAVHLNFSEFSQKKLAQVIPSRNTRVLIYGDNNLQPDAAANTGTALTLPTFLQLVTYRYPNVYVLSELVSEQSGLLAK